MGRNSDLSSSRNHHVWGDVQAAGSVRKKSETHRPVCVAIKADARREYRLRAGSAEERLLPAPGERMQGCFEALHGKKLCKVPPVWNVCQP